MNWLLIAALAGIVAFAAIMAAWEVRMRRGKAKTDIGTRLDSRLSAQLRAEGFDADVVATAVRDSHTPAVLPAVLDRFGPLVAISLPTLDEKVVALGQSAAELRARRRAAAKLMVDEDDILLDLAF
jgi:hypothetical protein